MRRYGILVCVFLVAVTVAADGPPGTFGPTDPHELLLTGTNQKILVIYTQASDYRIPSSALATRRSDEDTERTEFAAWFNEMSWGQLTLDVAARPAAATAEFYTLPGGLIEYVQPAGVRAMEVRVPGGATSANPTPPMSVSASASGSGSSFTGDRAGDYRYAVTAYRNGNESTLTRVPGVVTIADGQSVTLTITEGAADVDRYLIYRTNKGATDSAGGYERIGQASPTGASTSFNDAGIAMVNVGNRVELVTAALEAAKGDANYDDYNGVAVVIYAPFLRGQASFTPETFTYSTGSINIEATYMSTDTPFGRFTHEIGHFLSLPDLYDVTTGFVISNWSTMDCACDGQLYGWEKDNILHYFASPSQVVELTRPAPGNPASVDPFTLQPTEVADTGSTLTTVKIRAADTFRYYVEARNVIPGFTSDQNIPGQGVIVTESVDVFPPSIYPIPNVRFLKLLVPGETFQPEPGGSVKIRYVSVNNATTPPQHNVEITLESLPQPDPRITDWSPPSSWGTPDLWVDSQREGGGFMEPATATPLSGNGEQAWVDHVNRVWARVENNGGSAATNVRVRFYVNTPGGIGDAGQFVELTTTSPMPINLAPGEVKFVYAEWTPTVGAHTCIRVEIDHLTGEADNFNNKAQENIEDYYSGSASPWHPVTIPLDLANPYEVEKKIYLRADGFPEGWTATSDHAWVLLPPKGRKLVNFTITPKPDAKRCSSTTINIWGQVLLGDAWQPYGGVLANVTLGNPIGFQISTKKINRFTHQVSGCTAPPQPDTELTLILQDENGHDHVVFTKTDASGCFTQVVTLPDAKPWTVRPFFKGDSCDAPTEGTPIPLNPSGGGNDGSGGDSGLPGERGDIEVGVFTGGNWPVGHSRDGLDPGFLYGGDVLYAFNPAWRAGVQVAYHDFNATGITNASFIVNFRQPWGPYRLFLTSGIGGYQWNGSAHAGLLAGGGVEFPLTGSTYLMTGATMHAVSGGVPKNPIWVEAYLGFRAKWP